ncbi:MAG: ATP-dependent transcriptional regulator, MalT-like, LuxR family [Actinomycetia bacterium]|nr:ATP-dependent transcriptional regulator, MalT-like, LuxR family [Actinomycetes bacterium]
MTEGSGRRGRATGLMGRRSEREGLDRLIEAVRTGHGRALVVRGDPGVGKTVLLEYLAGRASGSGCAVARAVGVQSEVELAFAGLHQLCAPMLSRAERLPAPQREALRVAFGLSAGPPPDGFLVGLAVLSLMSEVAGERPLACLIDDAQWLDRASAQALGFAARRLAADPVGLVLAARVPGEELATLPELTVRGLRDRDARALLESALAGPLDERVRDLIVAETQGNPLALLELPRGSTPAELAGGFGLPAAVGSAGARWAGARWAGAGLPGRTEDSYARQLQALPDQTRRLLLLAAADPSGDRSLMWRAAGRLGIPVQAAAPAVQAGLVELGARVRFRHPLARSAAYRLASFTDRQEGHGVLATVTDPVADPDRRAWHQAQAAPGPDEDVAAKLENSVGRAQARGGLAAAAAFMERAVLLTADPARRAERALAAAQANLQAGAFGTALELLFTAGAGLLDEFQQARVDLLRGQIAFASGLLAGDAGPLLLKAARRLEPLNLDLARETYLSAWMAALFAGRPVGLLEVSRAARTLPPPADPPRPVDLILDGLAQLVTDGPATAAGKLRQAARAFTDADLTTQERLRWGSIAPAAAGVGWDDDAWRVLLERQVRLANGVGALDQLPADLGALSMSASRRGDFTKAASLIEESDAVHRATGSRAAPCAAMMLAALRGDRAQALPLMEATIAGAAADGQGHGVTCAHWSAAVLDNGLGRYDKALAAARQASEDTPGLYVSMWALPELIEAAARGGNTRIAGDALARLAETTQTSGTEFGLGIEARCRALLATGAAAEDYYGEAIERLGRTQLRPELARAHLLYGEWLRREKRRVDARAQLRTAHEMLHTMGVEAFAERAGRELAAAGETVRKWAAEPPGRLTPQELQIARLARDGRTNPEIGVQMFLSARTVEWHLSNVFTKLGIGSRRELRAAPALRIPDDGGQ